MVEGYSSSVADYGTAGQSDLGLHRQYHYPSHIHDTTIHLHPNHLTLLSQTPEVEVAAATQAAEAEAHQSLYSVSIPRPDFHAATIQLEQMASAQAETVHVHVRRVWVVRV